MFSPDNSGQLTLAGGACGTRLNQDRLFLLEHIRFDKKVERAEGHYLFDEHGTAYLDFLAQYGAVPFGHNPAFLWDAIDRVRDRKEPAMVQPLLSPGAERLAEALTAVAPGSFSHVTFTNSGAESVEVAIKMARARTGRSVILSTESGFHGKTLGAASATGNPIYSEPFLADTTQFERVPYNDLTVLEERLAAKDVAAFIVEPVQGEGGMIEAESGYLAGASRLCARAGTLFVLDEIQTGMGRTGTLFAAEQCQAEADILLLAKALGGGIFSLGACLANDKAWSSQFGYWHSSTFANNHLSCTVGLAVLNHLLEDSQHLISEVRRKGTYLAERLNALVVRFPSVFHKTSGAGLMRAVHLQPWSGERSYFLSHASHTGNAVPLICGYLLNRHRIATVPSFNNKQAIRIQPSLTIEYAEIDRLLLALNAVGELIQGEDYATLLDYIHSPDQSSGIIENIRIDDSPSANGATSISMSNEKRLGKYAFLIHPLDESGLRSTCQLPSFTRLTESQQEAWCKWSSSWLTRRPEPGIAYHQPALSSRTGGYAEGWLLACPLTPAQMLRLRKPDRTALMASYLKIARDLDVDIVGLGAFTSIITRAGSDVLSHGVNITTGNSLTAMSSVEGITRVAEKFGVEMSHATVGVIGAAGSVGRLVCKRLATVAGRIILFGNPKNPKALRNLRVLAGDMYQEAARLGFEGATATTLGKTLGRVLRDKSWLPTELLEESDEGRERLFEHVAERFETLNGTRGPIHVTVNLDTYLPTVDVVVSATSQGEAFIAPSLLAQHALVCDVARPSDVLSVLENTRPDVVGFEGGLMKLPEPIRFGSDNVVDFPDGVNLACLSETISLAMSGCTRHYSVGSGVPLAEAEHIYEQALSHGFRVHVDVNGVDLDEIEPPSVSMDNRR